MALRDEFSTLMKDAMRAGEKRSHACKRCWFVPFHIQFDEILLIGDSGRKKRIKGRDMHFVCSPSIDGFERPAARVIVCVGADGEGPHAVRIADPHRIGICRRQAVGAQIEGQARIVQRTRLER